jgi:hypothetical protein
MALRKSAQANQRMSAPHAMGNQPLCAFGVHTIVAAQAAAADVIEMIPWPAGTVLHSLKVEFDDADSNGTPTMTIDVGILTGEWLAALEADGDARVCGDEFGANLTTPQAGGSLDVAAALMLNLPPSPLDRSLGFKVEAAAATLVAGAKFYMSAIFLPAPVGVAEV